MWPRGEDHKLESREVTRNRPLIPEQEGTGPPHKDLKSKGALQARIQWRTSWISCPQAGRGTFCTWWDAFMPPKLAPSIPDSGTATRISSFRPWKNVRGKWLDIKELTPLCYMCYVAKCFVDSTGHDLKGLGLHTRWIRARSYYHWRVAKLHQLQHCTHLQGIPVPPGPMECPSMLQQSQRPNTQGAVAPAT